MTQLSGSLGERIAFHRKRRGLSQVELARLVNRSESWVSQVERGARHVDRLSVLAQVADVLNVPVTELAPRGLFRSPLSAPLRPAFAQVKGLLKILTVEF